MRVDIFHWPSIFPIFHLRITGNGTAFSTKLFLSVSSLFPCFYQGFPRHYLGCLCNEMLQEELGPMAYLQVPTILQYQIFNVSFQGPSFGMRAGPYMASLRGDVGIYRSSQYSQSWAAMGSAHLIRDGEKEVIPVICSWGSFIRVWMDTF